MKLKDLLKKRVINPLVEVMAEVIDLLYFWYYW